MICMYSFIHDPRLCQCQLSHTVQELWDKRHNNGQIGKQLGHSSLSESSDCCRMERAQMCQFGRCVHEDTPKHCALPKQ